MSTTQPAPRSAPTSRSARSIKEETRRRSVRLSRHYVGNPDDAMVTDCAWTDSGQVRLDDPLHAATKLQADAQGEVMVGVHRAVGGLSDLPTPGDVLAGALAVCADSTIRMVANRFNVDIAHLSVRVEGRVDVRGTLCVDNRVPVGFQSMDVAIDLRPAHGTDPSRVAQVLAFAEHCCVVAQTLRNGVEVRFDQAAAAEVA